MTTAMIDDLNWPERLRLLWRLLRDDRVSPWLKRLGPLGALLYLLWPIDIVPDFFIGVGQFDDFGVIAVMVVVLSKLMVRFAPPAVVAEHLADMGRGCGRRGVVPDAAPVVEAAYRERSERK